MDAGQSNGGRSPSSDPKVCLLGREMMLKDRKRVTEKLAHDFRLRAEIVQQYGEFLRTLFSVGDWFVTLTFRDRHQDAAKKLDALPAGEIKRKPKAELVAAKIWKCDPDPRIADWEPYSKNRVAPGPPVRDAALREIEHWLLELGWEASGHTRQEIFDRLAAGLTGPARRAFAKTICRKCLICAALNAPVTFGLYLDIRATVTSAIGWVIAEEFGRHGGRWHVHLLIKGVRHLRRRKWWKRAFIRFGRSRIEPLHE